MGPYYREFLGTRESAKRGFDLVETETGSDIDGGFRAKVMRILNRFEYDSYEKTGIFLFYEETMKSFVIAKAQRGITVDSRVNMQITLRIPKNSRQDGFEECIAFLQEWEKEEGKAVFAADTAKEICQAYGISREWLSVFLKEWLRSICAFQAETIHLCDTRADGTDRGSFAAAMARLCYELTPQNRITKYSFAWNVSPEKCIGFRILAGEKKQEGTCFDLAKSPDYTESPEIFMTKRIAEEAFRYGGRAKHFMNAFDWYYLKASDYDSMIWNFYYYLLDQKESLPCNGECFFQLKQGLEKQRSKGVEKAGKLYGELLFSLTSVSMSEQEKNRVLNIYLEYLLLEKNYDLKHLHAFWNLLESCADEGETEEKNERILAYIEQIKEISEKLYYALVDVGLEKEKSYLLKLFAIDHLDSAAAFQNWLFDGEHKKLIENEAAKQQIMKQLRSLFTQSRSPEEIEQLVRLGLSIDKKQCPEIVETYLREGTEVFLLSKDAKGWAEYLIARRVVWESARPFLFILDEQYLQLAETVSMPIDQDEAEFMISMGNIFIAAQDRKKTQQLKTGEKSFTANGWKVQRVLLDRFCECWEEKEIGGKENRKYLQVLRLLLRWQAGNKGTEEEFQRARILLGRWNYHEASHQLDTDDMEKLLNYRIQEEADGKEELYDQWLQQVCRLFQEKDHIEKICKELSEQREDLEKSCSPKLLQEMFLKMIHTAKAEDDMGLMVLILKTAVKYQEKVSVTCLTEIFWKGNSVQNFARIFKYQQKFFGKEKIFSDFPAGTEEESLYEIYSAFCTSGTSEKLQHKLYEMKDSADRQLLEKFLTMLMWEWLNALRKRIAFTDLLDLLMVYWENEKDLTDAVYHSGMDYGEQEEILDLMDDAFEQRTVKKLCPDLRGDILQGGVLGAGLGMATGVIKGLMGTDQTPAAVISVLIFLVLCVIAITFYMFYGKERMQLPLLSLLIALAVWLLLFLLLLAVKEKAWIGVTVSLIVMAVCTGGILFQKKKEEGE